jgi:type I restriction enzyme S subunit
MSAESRYESMLEGLPTDWGTVPIAELGKVVSGSTPSRDVPAYWGGKIPWVTPGELTGLNSKHISQTNESITSQGLSGSGANLLPEGSLLVTTRATLGARAINSVPMATNQGFKSIVFRNPGEADYYYYWTEKLVPELTRRASGTTFLEISGSQFSQIRVPNPPQPERVKITQILDTLDTQIRQTEALIAKLERIKQGLLTDLLTRGIDQDGQLRPTPGQAPHLYKDSPLGQIPREWAIREMREVADVVDPQPDHRTPPETDGGVPYIGIGDFDWAGNIDTSACRKVIWSAYDKQKARFAIRAEDIIFGKIGTIGLPKKLPAGIFALSANVLLIQPKGQRSFIFHFLNSEGLITQVKEITNTTSQPALGIETMRKLLVPDPAEQVKSRIAEVIDAHESVLKAEVLSLNQLSQQKAGLMDDLLTGRVRVTPLLDTAEQAHG